MSNLRLKLKSKKKKKKMNKCCIFTCSALFSLHLGPRCITADAFMIREKLRISFARLIPEVSAGERDGENKGEQGQKESGKENDGGKEKQSPSWHLWDCVWVKIVTACCEPWPRCLGSQRCKKWLGGSGQERWKTNRHVSEEQCGGGDQQK